MKERDNLEEKVTWEGNTNADIKDIGRGLYLSGSEQGPVVSRTLVSNEMNLQTP
jgi:hypothetical protein